MNNREGKRIKQKPFWQKSKQDFMRDILRHQKLQPKTHKYIEHSLDLLLPLVEPPEVDPYYSRREDGRNLSQGELLWWYIVDNRHPTVISGGSGEGKSHFFKFLERKAGIYTQVEMGTSDTQLSHLMPIDNYNPRTKMMESIPGILDKPCILGGILLIEEFANIPGIPLKTLNTVDQGGKQSILTRQFGLVDIPWQNLTMAYAGNCHDTPQEWDPSVRYRKIWVESTDDDRDLDQAICTKQLDRHEKELAERFGWGAVRPMQVNDEGLFELDIDRFYPVPKNEDLKAALKKFSVELRVDVNDIQRKHQRIQAEKGLVTSLFGNGIRNPWRAAPKISRAVMGRAAAMYHPIMTRLDYRQVLVDILLNPAIATERNNYQTETGFKTTVESYISDVMGTIDQYLDMYFDRISDAARK